MDEPTAMNWQQIRSSLGTFDRAATREALQEVLNWELPPQTQKLDAPWGLAVKIDKAIATVAGKWYGAGGVVVGNESISDWCWCHSFMSSIKAGDRQEQVEQGAQAVLEQVEVLHQFLVNLCNLFDKLPWSNDLEALEDQIKVATEEIINFVIAETRCNEAWYHYATDAVCWFLDNKDIPVSEPLRSQIEISIEGSFTSWIAPADAIKHNVSEAIAFEIFKQEFERQYS